VDNIAVVAAAFNASEQTNDGSVSRPRGPDGVAVLGLGEAGAALASDLVLLGVRVLGWDPDASRSVAGVRAVRDPAATAACEVILSVNSQSAACEAARAVRDVLSARHLYVDVNTTSPEVKREVAAILAPAGAAFVDAALLDPVPRRGIRTRCLASGPGAARFAALFGGLGMPVDVLGPEPGEAAARKLLRSVVMKGMAAAAIESLAAARAAGCEEWLHAEVAAIFERADAGLLDRFVSGSAAHAGRRTLEMEAAAALEVELGVEPHIAAAAANVLRLLAQG
jgi:Domain of unknown function (DUF1932)/NAD binding domain of 6-phosphogluconate dehydrogenase